MLLIVLFNLLGNKCLIKNDSFNHELIKKNYMALHYEFMTLNCNIVLFFLFFIKQIGFLFYKIFTW